MGFLKFLKRGKKESLDELDLPPAPPPLEGFEENLPELPELPDFEEKISAPEHEMGKEMKFDFPENAPDFSKDDFPRMDLPEEKIADSGEMPEFPDFPEFEEKLPVPPVRAPMPQVSQPAIPAVSEPQQEPEEEKPSFATEFPRMGRRLFAHEKRREIPRTIYVRVDNFKATLGSISLIRSDLRKSEEALMKLENIKNSKDKSFDKVRASLDDLQKKLIFIDKTLFKGE